MSAVSQEQFEQAVQSAVAAHTQQLQQQVHALQTAFQNLSSPTSSSPTRATQQLGNTGFVDSKIGKLPNLRDEQGFIEWTLKTTAFVASQNIRAAELLRKAETAVDEILEADLSTDEVKWSQQLYFMLIMQCEGNPLRIVHHVSDNNGFEAYRQLHKRYNPKSHGRALARLTNILAFEFGDDPKTFLDKITEWERLIGDYENDGKDKVSDSVRCAVIAGRCPKDVRTHLTLTMSGTTDYMAVKRAIESYNISSRAWSSTAMEVDFLQGRSGKFGKNSGKNKGHGKDYGKFGKDSEKFKGYDGKNGKFGKDHGKFKSYDGKDPGKSGGKNHTKDSAKKGEGRKINGYCNKCGKWGHPADECRSSGKGVSAVEANDSDTAGKGGETNLIFYDGDWIFAIGPEDTREYGGGIFMTTYVGEKVSLLADSGSSVTCCGPNDFPHVQIEPSPEYHHYRSANGSSLRHYGFKTVHFTTDHDENVKIKFEVLDVTRPILSVSRLREHGHRVSFEDDCYIQHKASPGCPARRLGLVPRMGLFFLQLWVAAGLGQVGPGTAPAKEEPLRCTHRDREDGARSTGEGLRQKRSSTAYYDIGDKTIPEHNEVVYGLDDAIDIDIPDAIDAFPKAIRAPMEPSPAERDYHELTHTPFAPWCTQCVRSRSRDDHYKKVEAPAPPEARLPVVQIDYFFVKANESEELVKGLTAVDDVYGRLVAIPCSQKGRQDTYAVQSLIRFCQSLGFERFFIRADSENSSVDVAKAVCEKMTNAQLSKSPIAAKGSLGKCERAHQTIEGLMRTFRSQVHMKYQVELPSSHPIMHWAMRHAAWIHERFTVDSRDHMTAYERHMLRKYAGGLATFGETVVWRQPGQHKLKLKEHWGFGIWLGRDATSDSHIVGTRHGCLTARAIRRLAPSERHDKQLLLAMQGTPGHLAPRSVTEEAGSGALVAPAPPVPEAVPEAAPEPMDDSVENATAPVATRPRGRPVTRVLPDPGSPEYTASCSACNGKTYAHSAACQENMRHLLAKKIAFEDVGTETKKQKTTSSGSSGDTRPATAAIAVPRPTSTSTSSAALTFVPSTVAAPSADSFDAWANRFLTSAKTAKRATTDSIEEPGTKSLRTSGDEPMVAAATRDDVSRPEELCMRGDYWDEDGILLDQDLVQHGMLREKRLMEELDVKTAIQRDQVPKGTRIWTGRWCHRMKKGEVRSRYVVRQFKGEYDTDPFSGTPGVEAVRIVLMICSHFNYAAVVGDFSVAFMHTPVGEETIIIEPPREVEPDKSVVWQLKKALNGLRSASAMFQKHLFGLMKNELGFRQCIVCPTLLIHDSRKLLVVVHVDDPLVGGPADEVHLLFEELSQWLTVKETGDIKEATQFLGSIYTRSRRGFTEEATPTYIDSIVEAMKTPISKRAVSTPGVSMKAPDEHGRQYVGEERHRRFRQVVGKIQFLAPRRPDVLFALKEVARHLQAPREHDWDRLERIVRYLAGTKDMQLRLEADGDINTIYAFSDADWAGCPEERLSTGCALVFWCGGLIHSHSRTIRDVSLSSGESEFYGITAATGEALYVQEILKDIGIPTSLKILTDASTARAICVREGVGKVRHLAARLLWIQQKVQDKAIEIEKISTEDNCADIGTKNLDAYKMTKFMKAIGIGQFIATGPPAIALLVGCIIAQATLADATSDIDQAEAGHSDDHYQFGLLEFMITTWVMMIAITWRLTRTTSTGSTTRRTVGVQTDGLTESLAAPLLPLAGPGVQPRVFRSRRAGSVEHLYRDCRHLANCISVEETAVCLTCIKATRC